MCPRVMSMGEQWGEAAFRVDRSAVSWRGPKDCTLSRTNIGFPLSAEDRPADGLLALHDATMPGSSTQGCLSMHHTSTFGATSDRSSRVPAFTANAADAGLDG